MTREIIKGAIERANDVVLAAELRAEAPLEAAVDEQRAEVLIFGTSTAGLPESCSDLMRTRQRTRVLTIEREGRSAVLYELRPYAVPLGQVSPASLLDAIRGSVSRR